MTARVSLFVVLVMTLSTTAVAEPPTRAEATAAMHRAVRFFREHASAGGGYVYRLSADLLKREGEGKVGPATAWVEPPGTPAVGMAYLEAYRLTRDPVLLEAARETAEALVRGQLESGGWDNGIEFDPDERRKHAYRVEVHGEPGKRRNVTTFDDDKSQSAVRFLMQLDRDTRFEDAALHEATEYALRAFVRAQYPNGAWPQRFSTPPDPDRHPVLPASYPKSWTRKFPKPKYAEFYTLNDDTLRDLVGAMLDAYDVYGEKTYLESAKRGGDFLLRARMPEPQPAWAQQYDLEMHPAWARRFEPPAITGGESQGAVRTLLELARRTGDRRYLEPIPGALDYLKRSELPNGRLARFYELRTNRPLYFTREYELVYTDDDLPTHYGFTVDSRVDRLRAEFEKVRSGSPRAVRPRATSPAEVDPPRLTRDLARKAERLVNALDDRGAWVEDGRLKYHGDGDRSTRVIESRTFAGNLVELARYVAAVQGADE